MKDYIIGVDIGTGSTKAVAVDDSGNGLARAQRFYSTHDPAPGHCEQDPELVFTAFRQCVSDLTATIGKPRAVVLSSAMHSVIPVNETGAPLHPMLLWSDNRSGGISERINAGTDAHALYEQTGTPIHPMSPLTKIIWLRENLPQLFAATRKFISIKEYIWFRMFNTFEVDHSIASATGLMDIHTLQWHPLALQYASIDSARLSAIVSTSFRRSGANEGLAKTMGLSGNEPFIIGASDGCLANLGSFVSAPGAAALTIGTSGAIRITGTKPLISSKAMLFNYRLDETTFVSGGPTNNGGAVLRWFTEKILGKKLERDSDYLELLSALSQTAPNESSPLFLPYVYGERAPIWDSRATGIFFGLSHHHTQHDLVYAVVEGISLALFDIADRMKDSSGTIRALHVSGGFIKSPEWLQLLADIFQVEVRVISTDDASALGAAYIGLKSLGLMATLEEIVGPAPIKILPNKNHAEHYRLRLQKYRALYAQNKKLMHES